MAHDFAGPELGADSNSAQSKGDFMKFTRLLTTAVLAIVLVFGSAFGQRHRHTYRNVEGRRVHSPVFRRSAPAGASAQCRDGSYSFSRHHQGTCSHHGGVERWL